MKQANGTALSKIILVCTTMAVLGGILICCFMGLLTNLEMVRTEIAQWLSVLVTDGVLLLCCWYAANKAGKGRLQVSGVVAGAYLLTCLLGKAMLCSGYSITFDWRMVLPIAAALGGGILASRRKTRHR